MSLKASVQRSTGLMIGSWNPSDDEVMMQDALNKGIPADDVELREVSCEEHAALISDRDAVTMSYADKRKSLYPSIYDLADAMVKKGSLDPVMQAAGEAQFKAYVEKCLAVKTLISKE